MSHNGTIFVWNNGAGLQCNYLFNNLVDFGFLFVLVGQKSLSHKYDQPRHVYEFSVKGLTSLTPPFLNTGMD